MKGISRTTWLFMALGLLIAALMALPQRPIRGMDVDRFLRLPVQEGGRIKPLDSIGRNSLLMLRGQQQFKHDGHLVNSSTWLMDVLFHPEVADQYPTFVINDPEVLGLMKMEQGSSRYYSYAVIEPHLDAIEKQAMAADEIPSNQRTRFQTAVVNLYRSLLTYHRLQLTFAIPGTPGLGWEMQEAPSAERNHREGGLTSMAYFRMLPPQSGQAWLNTGEALRDYRSGRPAHAGLAPLARLQEAWVAGHAAGFNGAVDQLTEVAAQQPAAVSKASHEALFNRSQPFIVGMALYVAAMLAVFVSWLVSVFGKESRLLKPSFFLSSGVGLLVAGVLVHTAAITARVIIQGYAPVTNLYSSAIFVGWAAAVVGLVLERLYGKGYGTVVASMAGFSTLIIAHHLGQGGDTMEMMRAVLDSNFWLSTHVVTITIGYSGMFLAGSLAIAYAVRRLVVQEAMDETGQTLVRMTYGVLAFALFFSFVGTVLGGIWADQSWGRFWGWDPKENGALLIVLWVSIILHARWGGYARTRGVMAMAIFGNIITSLSWFGVNMLGVGLHSYGFMDSALFWLGGFILSQLVLMGLLYIPRPGDAKAA